MRSNALHDRGAIIGLDVPERRHGVLAFGVRVQRIAAFPLSAGLLVDLDEGGPLRPFDVVVPRADQHAKLLPHRDQDIVAVIGPREDFGGIAHLDVELQSLRIAEAPSVGCATFKWRIADRYANDLLMIPVKVCELRGLGEWFGREMRFTLGTIE